MGSYRYVIRLDGTLNIPHACTNVGMSGMYICTTSYVGMYVSLMYFERGGENPEALGHPPVCLVPIAK